MKNKKKTGTIGQVASFNSYATLAISYNSKKLHR